MIAQIHLTAILVLGSICLLVPLSLLAAFRVSKDSGTYQRHYDAQGYSLEVCNRNCQRVANADSIMTAANQQQKRRTSRPARQIR